MTVRMFPPALKTTRGRLALHRWVDIEEVTEPGDTCKSFRPVGPRRASVELRIPGPLVRPLYRVLRWHWNRRA